MNKADFSEGEWKIMNLLWDESPRNIMQITAALHADTGWSKHTVITMLSRLEKKGGVIHEEGERAKQFYPALPREDVALSETRGFLNKVYKGSLSLLVNAMIDQESVSRDELRDLREILDRAEVVEHEKRDREGGR